MSKALKTATEGLIFKGASTFFGLVSGLIVSIILNRFYGKDLYGYLVIVFSITTFFVGFADFGTRQTIIRFIPRHLEAGEDRNVKVLMTSSLLIFGAVLFISSVSIFIFSDMISKSIFKKEALSPILKAGALFFIGVSISEFFSEVFQALQNWKREMAVSAGYPLLYLLFTCVTVFLFRWSIGSVLWANFLAAVIIIVFMFKFIRDNFITRITTEEFMAQARIILNFGLPTVLINLNFYFLVWFDKMVLGRFYTTDAVADYYIAFMFFNAMILFFKVLFVVLRPYFSGLSVYMDNRKLIKERFQFLFRWFIHTAILASIVAFFLIKPVIVFLYGNGYQNSIAAFRLLLMVFFVRAIVHPMGIFMINVFGDTKRSAILGTILVVVTMVFDILLIPSYGYKGAILATLIGYLVWWALVFVLFRQFISIFSYSSLAKTVAMFCVMAFTYVLAHYFFPLHEILWILILTSLYLALLWFAGEIKAQDINILKKVFRFSKEAIAYE